MNCAWLTIPTSAGSGCRTQPCCRRARPRGVAAAVGIADLAKLVHVATRWSDSLRSAALSSRGMPVSWSMFTPRLSAVIVGEQELDVDRVRGERHVAGHLREVIWRLAIVEDVGVGRHLRPDRLHDVQRLARPAIRPVGVDGERRVVERYGVLICVAWVLSVAVVWNRPRAPFKRTRVPRAVASANQIRSGAHRSSAPVPRLWRQRTLLGAERTNRARESPPGGVPDGPMSWCQRKQRSGVPTSLRRSSS